ncbi:DNA repair protein Rad7, protein [Aspergillus mulundensis]|uniref:DNA repair protein rhp7 treble clef domain-containing protein n=1 Tax=Aspergillus mulundensis TaxID=1810919 RepID=A0A3D8T3W9_9EURO|nr:Uncharacterized protein DSM5745_00566 [Aspergillus mulundensis]RDW93244.1 Uncharacterized protein DSM5745_00566 [Aspergillus mulundensis]
MSMKTMSIKQSKEFARRKARRIGEPDDDDDFLAREMMDERPRPLPGQFENCENCNKRFTVTPYSKTGSKGGLLCAKCSKEVGDQEKKSQPKKRGPRSARRQNQSDLLDGIAQHGALSLAEMCTKKVADNIQDITEFGDLPWQLLQGLSQILSKRRAITPRTLDLFLRPDLSFIDIYDSGKLEANDFQKIFAFMPALTRVNLRFAGQLKDNVIDYMLENHRIQHLQLDSANLVSDSSWRTMFEKLGLQLENLRLSNLDSSLDDESIEIMCNACTRLRRLKLTHCWKMSDRSLQAISTLPLLEHLSLDMLQESKTENLVELVSKTGTKLRTLSLQGFSTADDTLLEMIHDKCRHLFKFRFSDNATCTDRGFTQLFETWSNPPLEIVDLSSTRDIDNANPDGPTDATGLASNGFIALMNHSGSAIRKLNIASCRHISYAAFDHVFTEGKSYPKLRELDVSFHTVMDDYLMGRIFQCCPAIQQVVAFACFSVRDARVPKGVSLIGGLRTQDPFLEEA